MTEEVAAPVAPEAPEAPAEGGGQPAAGQNADAAPATPADGKPADTKADAPEQTPEEAAQAAENKARNHRQREINRATKRYYEEKAKREFLEQRLAELTPKEAAPEGAPKLEQFNDIEEYAKAVGKHERAQAVKEYEANQRSMESKRSQERLLGQWEAKAERGAEKYDDFEQVVGDLQPTTPLLTAIIQADNAEEVAYYLAKNQDEAKRIASLDPIAQVRAIGKLEAKLSAEPPKPITPSKAPAPISPVGGNKGASNDEPSDKDDINTWMRKENARMKRLAGHA